ncbi:diaminopimelate epimerase [Clostridium sp. 19966]|uniref:diaminopimelate epimerase n=1 Tax=Clostridium sp. 19966 TaxID=2768166 RepID=UPI0028E08C06|nr:diaminopimelate epimerase [Clostridium sp. 19966]MDT8716184.1 diaminopimelate epimerase [Clostridium sp. 19966]
MKIPIIKCHGTGNDFILIDEISHVFNFNEEQRRNLAITLCDRKKSIGADGILFVQKSSSCHGKMRIFNADGTEPEMCGNGLRCVGRYVLEAFNMNEVTIETMKAQYLVKKMDDLYEGVKTVKITIDSITFNAADLPLENSKSTVFFENIKELSENLTFSAVSVTNPHLVSIMDEICEEELVKVGKTANSGINILPKGVNVNFVKVISPNNIYVKTYERGVGLTKACGTGMTASVVVCTIAGKCPLGEEINVFNDGGMIKCIVNKIGDKYSVEFIGNATYVFRGTLDSNKLPYANELESREEILKRFDYKAYDYETIQYEKMYQHTRDILKKSASA